MEYVGSRTVRRSIEICERRRSLCVYIAGGLGGLGIYGAGDAASAGIFDTAPAVFLPAFLSSAVCSAAFIAWAYSGYEYHATCLKRRVDDEQLAYSSVLTEKESTPSEAKFTYLLGTIFLGFTAIILLVSAWWAALCPVIH
jgi:hypothetical protein